MSVSKGWSFTPKNGREMARFEKLQMVRIILSKGYEVTGKCMHYY
jgi:hypothetical protein